MTARLTAIVTFDLFVNEIEEKYGSFPKSYKFDSYLDYINKVIRDTEFSIENPILGNIGECDAIKILTYNFLDINCKDTLIKTREIKLY